MRDDNRELVLVNHKTHLYWMVGLVVVGAGLFFSGAVGTASLGLLWPLACVGMMVAMMWEIAACVKQACR